MSIDRSKKAESFFNSTDIYNKRLFIMRKFEKLYIKLDKIIYGDDRLSIKLEKGKSCIDLLLFDKDLEVILILSIYKSSICDLTYKELIVILDNFENKFMKIKSELK